MSDKEQVNKYIESQTWLVKENANSAYSFSGLMSHLGENAIKEHMLANVYPAPIANAHKKGYIHVHDLGHGVVGYCSGWSLRQLLEEGFNGVKDKVHAAPPKHYRTALGQMVNFLGTMQMEFAGAQAFSSFDTYLAPFVAKDKLSYKEVKQGMQEFIFNMNVPSRWGCVTPDTEILTKNGWKLYSELKLNEELYGFDKDTGKIVNDKLVKLNIYDYDGALVVLKNRSQEQLLSPNHRVIRKVFNENKLIKETAADIYMYKTPIDIPVSGIIDNKNYNIENKFLELYAWILSEGTIPLQTSVENRIVIHQSPIVNKKYCEEIENILNSLGISYSKTFSSRGLGFGCNRYRLNRVDSRLIAKTIEKKKLPMNILRKCSAEQIKLFIDIYRKGDGTKSRFTITTADEEIADNFQELAALIGYGTSCKIIKPYGISTKDKYIISFLSKGNGFVTITSKDKVNYNGKIWCPTTVSGNWIARRKGSVFITGNSQAAFTNITLDWMVPEDMRNTHPKIGGIDIEETYKDFQKEMDLINKAFIEVMIEGDTNGRIFSFPIPTYNITKDFVWDNENAKLLFEMTAKYGTPYFQNFLNSTIKPSDIRSMCCRLALDTRELRMRGNGLFGAGEKTGSIGVVTINLPKLAYESKLILKEKLKEEGKRKYTDELALEVFLQQLGKQMDIAKDSLEIKRDLITKNLERGLMPFTRRYLDSWDTYFSTIGLVGMNEACLNILDKDIASEEGLLFAEKTLDFMRSKLSDYQEKTGNLYNLEATPAEGTTYRLALLDKEQYPEIIQQGCDDSVYYTNSSQLPVEYTDDMFLAIQHQNKLQVKYTGGTVLHFFLGERVTDWINCMLLVKKIANNTRMPYFSITPTFSICPVHGYISGEHQYCPLEHSEEQLKRYGIYTEENKK